MKYLFPLLFLILCCTGLSGDPLPSKPDGVEEKVYIPEPEEMMIGEWLGVVMNRDTPVLLARNRYIFLPSGTWEIQDEAADAKPEPQGWYKINRNEKKLLLQPKTSSAKGESSAVHAELRDENVFVISNPLDENNTLTFIRKSSLPHPSEKTLAGTWKMTQMDPESGEKRKAPFTLILKKDGTYTVEQPGEELPEEWAQGAFEVAGLRVLLHNKFKGTGLWQSPSFFLLDGKLRYNDGRYLLWCEKIGKDTGSSGDRPGKQDPPEKEKESKKH